MGTSVNQPSPRTTGWAAVAAGYQHAAVPAARVATEIWRAAQSEEGVTATLASAALFSCQETIRNCSTAAEALARLGESTEQLKNNSFVLELAKRAIPLAYLSNEPAKAWQSHLFASVTDYFVARDIPGYLGPTGRFGSLAELAAFKKTLRTTIATTVSELQRDIRTPRQWESFVRLAIARITGHPS
jgi:hypothetical protein